MTKAELVDVIVKVGDLNKKQATEMLDNIFAKLGEAIKTEGRLAYPGFGTFVVRERKARKGRDPRTLKEIVIKASKTIAFKPAPTLKNSL